MKFHIHYWHRVKFPGCPWEHNTKIDDLGLGLKHGVSIVHHILELGYNAMIRKTLGDSGDYVIFIDSGRFTQR